MLPSALDHVQEIAGRGDQLAVFLDYDGTLTAIVSHPKKVVALRFPATYLQRCDLSVARGPKWPRSR